PSFLSTKITGAHHGDELARINFLSNNSFNCFLSSSSSPADILYGLLAIGAVPGKRSMINSMSRSGGIPGKSSGNTSEYSHAILMSSIRAAFIRFTVQSADVGGVAANSNLSPSGLVRSTDLLTH